jgi:hypothetical protein
VAAAVLVEGRSLNEPLVITGPMAVSYAQIADELATAMGRPVRYIDPPPEAAHQASTDAGLPQWLVTDLDGAYTLVHAEELAVTTDTVQRYLNRPAHTIEESANANAEFFGNQVIDTLGYRGGRLHDLRGQRHLSSITESRLREHASGGHLNP